MKKSAVQQYLTGSIEYVLAHAKWQRKRGRKPSAPLIINNEVVESNPQMALQVAKEGFIGLSISLCIASMVRGEIPPSNVKKIIASTCCADDGVWDDVIASYKDSYWTDFPDEAEVLLRKFIKEGKVEQPRLNDNSRYPIIASGKWVASESKIQWNSGFF